MKNNHNEAIAGTDAFRQFAEEFGPDDIYNRIILEEILKVLLGYKEGDENGDKTE